MASTGALRLCWLRGSKLFLQTSSTTSAEGCTLRTMQLLLNNAVLGVRRQLPPQLRGSSPAERQSAQRLCRLCVTSPAWLAADESVSQERGFRQVGFSVQVLPGACWLPSWPQWQGAAGEGPPGWRKCKWCVCGW